MRDEGNEVKKLIFSKELKTKPKKSKRIS